MLDKAWQSINCDLFLEDTIDWHVCEFVWTWCRVSFSDVDDDIWHFCCDNISFDDAANLYSEALLGGESLEQCLCCICGELDFA